MEATLSDVSLIAPVARQLLEMPPGQALGACMAFLLYSSTHHRKELRAVLNEAVTREGFTGISMLTILARAAK